MDEIEKATPRRVVDDPDIMRQWDRGSNTHAPEDVLLSSKKRYAFQCPVHGTRFLIGLHILRRGSTACHPCRGHEGELQRRAPALEKHYSAANDVPFHHAPATRQRALFLCGECGTEFSAETREMAKLIGHPLCRASHGGSLGEVLDRLNLTLLQEYHGGEGKCLRSQKSNNTHPIYLRCPRGHEILTTGRRIKRCTSSEEACCNNGKTPRRLIVDHPHLEAIYSKDNPVPFNEVFYSTGEKFTWRSGYHIKVATVGAMIGVDPWRKSAMEIVEQGFNDLASIYPGIATSLHGKVDASSIHCHSRESLEWRCEAHPTVPYSMMTMERTQRGRGCPYCANRLLLPGYNDAATRYPAEMNRVDEEGKSLARTVFPSSGVKATWHCLDKPHHPSYEKTFKDVLIAGHQCPDCVQMGVSTMEREFGDSLEAASGIKLERNNRSVLGGHRELDLYSPELKVAIEFNGEYWHSSERARRVDAWKVKECQRRGISLLVITDREWIKSPQEALSRALRHLGGESW